MLQVYQPRVVDIMYLVFDRLEGGSVASLRRQEGHVEESFATYVMSQVAYAIIYCHNLGIAVSFSSPLSPRGIITEWTT